MISANSLYVIQLITNRQCLLFFYQYITISPRGKCGFPPTGIVMIGWVNTVKERNITIVVKIK